MSDPTEFQVLLMGTGLVFWLMLILTGIVTVIRKAVQMLNDLIDNQ